MGIEDFSMDFFSLKGKNAIVTGGNTGLGRAFSLALAKAGANLFIPSIRDGGEELVGLLRAEGVKAIFLKSDLTRQGEPARVIGACVKAFGSVDILVNSAGLCINVKDVLSFGREQWDLMTAINFTVPFEMSLEAARVMTKQRSGKIINICSLFSFLGGRWSPAYASTKHGLAGLTKAYCDELASYNIQVNGIAPGYYATEITADTRKDPAANRKVLDHIPADRWGEPLDLMGAVVFLAGRASDYINGHILAVDGGYLVR